MLGMQTFKQITYRDRLLISRLKACGYSISEIAKRVGKNKSSISRELKRNVFNYSEESEPHWIAEEAQRVRNLRTYKSNQIRRRKKVETKRWVIEKLKLGWSPEQIAGRSKVDAPEIVSHECVYQMIIVNKKQGGKLYRLLKRFNKRKSRFAPRLYEPANRPSIKARPKVVDELKRTGDLEADLIQGYRADGYVLTVIDRKTQLVRLRKLKSKHKLRVRLELEKALANFGTIHTLTVDNGKEFFDYKELQRRLKIDVYFADPYCSTQRARVENMNGLIRYYLPKKTSFRELSQSDLNNIESLLNNRPRKSLKFLTPIEFHRNFSV